MRFVPPLMLSLLAATAGRAELPPQAYERARQGATSVIVVEIEGVDGLRRGEAAGSCLVRGRVAAVERGDEHQAGQPVELPVPCIGKAWRPRPGPFLGYRHETLTKVRYGRFFLRDGRLVIRGFDDAGRHGKAAAK